MSSNFFLRILKKHGLYIFKKKMLSMLALVFANRLLIILMVNRLVETHIFSFVVGRAFVTDIEKLKISSKTRSLDVAQVLKFFSEVTKVCL